MERAEEEVGDKVRQARKGKFEIFRIAWHFYSTGNGDD
jgi:hypothetical protein